jgi:mono/diheme cytochrome c family protein
VNNRCRAGLETISIRTFVAAVVAMAGLAAPIVRVPLRAEQAAARATSVWDGAYTLAQAKRGALKSGLCVNCHGDEFRGGPSPELAGPDFLARWDGRSVGDLFDLIRLRMPDDDPGALPREQYADLVAYILAVNKFPTGSTEIGIDTAPLKQIQILAERP